MISYWCWKKIDDFLLNNSIIYHPYWQFLNISAMFLSCDKLTIICSCWLFKSPSPAQHIIIESALVLIASRLHSKSARPLFSNYYSIPPRICGLAWLWALSIKAISLEFSLVVELARMIDSSFSLSIVVTEWPAVVRSIWKNEGSFAVRFSFHKIADVIRMICLVKFP